MMWYSILAGRAIDIPFIESLTLKYASLLKVVSACSPDIMKMVVERQSLQDWWVELLSGAKEQESRLGG